MVVHKRDWAALSASEVSYILNLHINTIRRWSDKGILKAYRVGPRGDRRFSQEDINKFVIAAEQQKTDQPW